MKSTELLELSKMTNRELKNILRDNQIKNYSKLNKKDLVKKVNKLINNQSGRKNGGNAKNKKYTLKELVGGFPSELPNFSIPTSTPPPPQLPPLPLPLNQINSKKLNGKNQQQQQSNRSSSTSLNNSQQANGSPSISSISSTSSTSLNNPQQANGSPSAIPKNPQQANGSPSAIPKNPQQANGSALDSSNNSQQKSIYNVPNNSQEKSIYNVPNNSQQRMNGPSAPPLNASTVNPTQQSSNINQTKKDECGSCNIL